MPGSTAWRWRPREGPRTGADLKALVDHARRVRTLMRYAPRKYDYALLEGLALNGALKPNLDKAGREKAIAKVAAWLGRGDPEAAWSGELAAEGGYLLRRLWRGVTDAHIVEDKFLVSAEARKLHALAAEQIEVYAKPSTLKTLRKGAVDRGAEARADRGRVEATSSRPSPRPRARRCRSPGRRSCSRRCSPPAARACRSSATRALAK